MTKYSVEFWAVGERPLVVTVPSIERVADMSGLLASTVYVVSVRASNIFGASTASSEALTVSTLPPTPPTAPTRFGVVPGTVTGGAVGLTWSFPEDIGGVGTVASEISGYRVLVNGSDVANVTSSIGAFQMLYNGACTRKLCGPD